MPTGDLSADQLAYRRAFVAATGMAPVVVTAWIGAESGWNVTKTDHNYLNVGPGEDYDSTAAAAARAAGLVNRSDNYAGIRDAIATGDPDAQVAAIVASPWEETNYANGVLQRVYATLSGSSPDTSDGQTDGPPAATPALSWPDLNPLDDVAGDLAATIARNGAKWVLAIGLVATALFLIVAGLLRATSADNRAADVVRDVAGTALAARTGAA